MKKPPCFLDPKLYFTVSVGCNLSVAIAIALDVVLSRSDMFRFITPVLFAPRSYTWHQSIQWGYAVLFRISLLWYDMTGKRYWPIIGEQAMRGFRARIRQRWCHHIVWLLWRASVMISLNQFDVLINASLLSWLNNLLIVIWNILLWTSMSIILHVCRF